MHKTLVDDWLASKERVVLPDMQPLENYDGINAPVEGVDKVSAMPDIVSKLKEIVETVDQFNTSKKRSTWQQTCHCWVHTRSCIIRLYTWLVLGRIEARQRYTNMEG